MGHEHGDCEIAGVALLGRVLGGIFAFSTRSRDKRVDEQGSCDEH